MVNSSPEDIGGLEAGTKPAQDAEKARDRAAKAQARAQRLGRDEKKSRKHDAALVALITSLIGDTSRELVLEAVLDALEAGLPSHFLVGAVSLSDQELSKFVRQSAAKLPHVIHVTPLQERGEFNERQIDPQLQLRMNAWFDDIVTSLFIESSVLATQKFLDLVTASNPLPEEEQTQQVILAREQIHARAVAVITTTFSWFLESVGMTIVPRKAQAYAAFILDEVIRRARSFLDAADPELVARGNIDLFGV